MLLPGPDTRVVELRVPGIAGATPESVTGAVATATVAGDKLGRIVRPADRMRRPAPAPSLHAGGRPVPRVIEGYVWSAMTSGGLAKASWALLFPFSLANVAHWMLPPIPEGKRVAHALGTFLRALLRLAALLLTMLLVGQLTVVSADLIAAQCLAPDAACLTSTVPRWVREIPGVRGLIGLLPVLLIVFAMHRLSTVDWTVSIKHELGDAPGRRMPTLPGGGVEADPDTPALRALHVTAALAVASLLVLGGPMGPVTAGVSALWTAALVLLAISMVGVFFLDDPTGTQPEGPGRWLRGALGTGPRRLLMIAAGALLIATAVLVEPPAGKLVGADPTAELLGALLALVAVVVAIVLAPAALMARSEWAKQARELRPWAGGWMAAPMLALAGLLGGGFGAGMAITVRSSLGYDKLALPLGYQWITLLWGTFAAIALVVLAVAVPLWLLSRSVAEKRGNYTPPEVALLHKDRPEDAKRAARKWRKATWQRRNYHRLLIATAGLLTAGAVFGGFFRALNIPVPDWALGLSGLGVATLAGLAGGFLFVVYQASQHPDRARKLGILADLASFWPREAHPTVPPCYKLKVVPEIVARACEHLKEPNTRVVLVGHSQGSLMAAVAAAWLVDSLPEYDRERIGLVTVGSQLQWAYPRGFPAVVPHSSLATLAGMLGPRWRALCRGTDALGGPVTTWSQQVYNGRMLGVGFRHDGSEGPLSPAATGPTGALVLGNDHWLPDPLRGPFPGLRWAPGVLGHNEYQPDPEWDRAVAIAAGLETP
ncbi:hypothetical protein NLX83_14745 [Allokutzneria sp. A3M-2-11 16]|uniref:lipase family protein n=1 Tax=Allokutzneria sp. A3M-2-11 16 TaxID=2962043 RepID=UPI0020B88435|nr:hypothetical protein [Allokutzneria sp. A3M-2-11 16]MCP3800522.1 hypothetical protein [Allokutzneria sp. A3M-2-11 16]